MSFIPPDSLNLTQVSIKLSATITQSAAGSFMIFNSISNNTTEISLLNSTTLRLNPNKQYFLAGPTNVITYNTGGIAIKAVMSSSKGPELHGCSFYNATTSQYLTQYPCRFWAFAFGGTANIGFAVLHPTSQTDIRLEYKYYRDPTSIASSQATVGGVFSGSSVVDEPDSYIYIYHN